MTLVKVYHQDSNSSIGNTELSRLSRFLPGVVAEALHVEEEAEAHLTENDVEVVVSPLGRRCTQHYDVGIEIEAMYFESREARRQIAEEQIVKRVSECLSPNLTFFIWLKLLREVSFKKGSGIRKV